MKPPSHTASGQRQLTFLSTFDRKIAGFKNEVETLKQTAKQGVKKGDKWPVNGLNTIGKSLIGAGAVYGLPAITDWARQFLARVDIIANSPTPPSDTDLEWLQHEIYMLDRLRTEAAIAARGGHKHKDAPSTSPDDPLSDIDAHAPSEHGLEICICIKDANIRKKIAFSLTGAGFLPRDVHQADNTLERINELAPELIIVDLDDKAPLGTALTSAITLDPLARHIPMLKLGDTIGGIRADMVGKPVNSQELLKKVRHLLKTGNQTQLHLRDPNLEELILFVMDELKRGLLDAATGEHSHMRFRMTDKARIVASTWSLIAQLRQSAIHGSNGAIGFTSAVKGHTSLISLGHPKPTQNAQSCRMTDLAPDDLQSLKGMRVVVANANTTVQQLFKRILSAHGVIVKTEENGRDAHDAIAASMPDFVIADLLLPDMDGWELEHRLRLNYRLKDTPILLLTSKERGVKKDGDGSPAPLSTLEEEDRFQIIDAIINALRPSLLLHHRFEQGRNFSGRIEQHGITTILKTAAKRRPDCRLIFRESWNDFEVTIASGDLASITMTGEDGSYASGTNALQKLLGIECGRFDVHPLTASAPPKKQFNGSIHDVLTLASQQLNRFVAMVKGENIMHIRAITMDQHELERYKEAVPDKLHLALQKLESGTPPGALVLQEVVPVDTLETLLLELIRTTVIVDIDAPEPRMTAFSSAPNTREWNAKAPGSNQTTDATEAVSIDDIEVLGGGDTPSESMRATSPLFRRWTWILLGILCLSLGVSLYFNVRPPGSPVSRTPADERGGHSPANGGPNEGPPRSESSAPTGTSTDTESLQDTDTTTAPSSDAETAPDAASRPPQKSVTGLSSSKRTPSNVAPPSTAPDRGRLRITVPRGTHKKIVVHVDGTPIGTAPLTKKLPTGLREVSFTSGDQRTIRIVSIKKGTTSTINANFIR